jgi:hypothetical protein
VRSQIRAAEELGVGGWILWNPQNHYTWSALQAGPIVRPPPEAAEPAAARKTRKAKVSAPAPEPLPATPPAEPKAADAGADAFGSDVSPSSSAAQAHPEAP